MTFYNEPGFWAFLISTYGTIRWLSRVIYLYVERTNERKASLELSVENVRADNAYKTIQSLVDAMSKIQPMVKRHEDLITSAEKNTEGLKILVQGLVNIVNPLNEGYTKFNTIVPKMTASIQLAVDEIAKMKTEILVLKKGSDMVFVTTKKGDLK
jgi:chromosome segregation ATPase